MARDPHTVSHARVPPSGKEAGSIGLRGGFSASAGTAGLAARVGAPSFGTSLEVSRPFSLTPGELSSVSVDRSASVEGAISASEQCISEYDNMMSLDTPCYKSAPKIENEDEVQTDEML
jgi:hypothetical protein